MIIGAPQYLILLILIPVLGGLVVLGSTLRKRRLRLWADTHLWETLTPSRSSVLRGLRDGLIMVALGFSILAAIRPQVGAKLVQVDRQGIDILVLLDVSLSMEATDVVPTRLERAKQEVRELFDDLHGDRVGILLFSGTSFLLCPMTLDISAANMFLDAITVDVLPDPGTNLESALQGAERVFASEEATGARAILVFTDGEAHEGGPLEVAKSLGKKGIPILTVGVGTPQGQPIPIRDQRGGLAGYKKDRSGDVVLSRLDENLLREMASASNGRFFPATLQGREIKEIRDFLSKLERGELGGVMRRRVEERYQVPAGIAAIFLFLSLLVSEARNTGRRSFLMLGRGGEAQ